MYHFEYDKVKWKENFLYMRKYYFFLQVSVSILILHKASGSEYQGYGKNTAVQYARHIAPGISQFKVIREFIQENGWHSLGSMAFLGSG